VKHNRAGPQAQGQPGIIFEFGLADALLRRLLASVSKTKRMQAMTLQSYLGTNMPLNKLNERIDMPLNGSNSRDLIYQ